MGTAGGRFGVIGSIYALMDTLRKAQGEALEGLGFGPTECSYEVLASGLHWRLRDYGGPDAGPSPLTVAAPIKRPYVWDLAPSVSAVRSCLRQCLRVYLLEWTPPSRTDSDAGLGEFAVQGIAKGHSLGGTLAAIYAALGSQSVKGPRAPERAALLPARRESLSGCHRRDGSVIPLEDVVPRSLLSQLSALASPETFVWSRWLDATLSSGDPLAWPIHARVERWALDEVPLPGRLVHQMLEWLYRVNRLCRGNLDISQRTVGPSCLRLPPGGRQHRGRNRASGIYQTFFDAMPGADGRVLEFPGEVGVGLQHLGILVGRQAYAQVWPEIISWLKAGAEWRADSLRERSVRTQTRAFAERPRTGARGIALSHPR
jgi:polyhydroxyalkanoate synthase